MILSVLTPDHAVQVSDRRLTDVHTGAYADVTPKTTVFNGSMLFGYTGLGVLGHPPEPTHRFVTVKLTESLAPSVPAGRSLHWLAAQLRDGVVAVAIPTALQSRASTIRRLAVAGVGFVRRGPDQPHRPVYVLLSNFWTKEAGWLREARPNFSILVESLPANATYWLRSAGEHLTRDERRHLERALNRAVLRSDGSQPIIRLLVEQVRAVAERAVTVGKSLLVSSIPLAAIPVEVSINSGPPDFTRPTFLYVPEDAYEGELYGPNVAGSGVAICDPWVSGGDKAKF